MINQLSNHRMHSIFVSCCDCLDCNCVQFALTFVGDLPATFLVLLNQSHLLELLHDVTQDLTRALGVGVGAGPAAKLTSIDLAESANANATTDVDLADNGCCACVNPIRIVRCK